MPLTTPPLGGLSRRSLLAAAGAGAAAIGLAACASPSGSGRAVEIVFHQSKPEVIGYFDEVI